MFKTETHLHTLEISLWSQIRASQLIKKYKEAGYSTVFITDHFQFNTLDTYGDISWELKTTLFLSSYYLAKCEGDKLGVNVLMGAEIRFTGDVNHYLIYGFTKEFLDKYPNIHTYGIEKFSKIAKENGVYIIQAHPYRDDECFPTPEYIDAVEVYNSNPRHNDYSEKSQELVEKYNFPISAGSDTHRLEDIALSGVETEEEIKTVEQFIKLVKERKVKVINGGLWYIYLPTSTAEKK